MQKLLLLGILSTFSANAQKHLSLVAAGQLHLTQAHFTDEALMSARVSLTPGLYTNWSVGIAADLSARTAIQATVGYMSYGLNIKTQQEGSRQDYASANVASFAEDAFEVAVVGRRYFPTAKRPKASWFVDAGADVVTGAVSLASIGFVNHDPNNPNSPGLTGTGSAIQGNPYRVGIRLGAGREWQVSPRSALAVQLVASLGLRDVNRYQVVITTWQQGPAIDPVYYTNTIATRLSFVGLQARYRLQLFGLH